MSDYEFCPKCGSPNIHMANRFDERTKYLCDDCGGWSYSPRTHTEIELRQTEADQAVKEVVQGGVNVGKVLFSIAMYGFLAYAIIRSVYIAVHHGVWAALKTCDGIGTLIIGILVIAYLGIVVVEQLRSHH